MIFYDAQVASLDLSTPAGTQELIEVHLCGHPMRSTLSPSDAELLQEFVANVPAAGVTFQQLNELLLVLNQDRLSPAFFEFFLADGNALLSRDQLKNGVVKFKGFAMVCFGNFRFGYRRLSTIQDLTTLRKELVACTRFR